jgi:uncharacterized protein (TIGR02147 family)
VEKAYYQKKLEDEFCRRKRSNPNYSLRAYSRFLGLAPAVVSSIFKGKRKPPKKVFKKLAEKLCLNPVENRLFERSLAGNDSLLKSLAEEQKPSDTEYTFINEQNHFTILAEWEHYAFLSLMDTADFKCDLQWIAKRMSISEMRVTNVLERLIKASLLERTKNGHLKKTFKKLATPMDSVSRALRESHKEGFDLAKEKLESISPDSRYFGSSTVAVDLNKIEEAKSLIREFRRKLSSFLESGNSTEVFQISIQMFPLTELRKGAIK